MAISTTTISEVLVSTEKYVQLNLDLCLAQYRIAELEALVSRQVQDLLRVTAVERDPQLNPVFDEADEAAEEERVWHAWRDAHMTEFGAEIDFSIPTAEQREGGVQ